MSDDASKFDPRFDPAFQRGYDGPGPSDSPRRPARRSRSSSPPDPIGLPPQYSAVERPIMADQRAAVVHSVTPRERAAHEMPEPQLEDAPRGRNPFLAILAAVGLLLILGGVVVLVNLGDLIQQANVDGGQSTYYYIQAGLYGAPMLICLGLATLIGVLFIYAVRWKRSA